MWENSLSVDKTITLIDKIKSINLQSEERDDLIEHLLQLNKHIAVITMLDIGRIIIRSVSCNYLKDDPRCIYPLKVKQLSFNPNVNACGFNRASWQGTTAFYGSIATEKMPPYYISSFEVLGDLQESKEYLNRESFVVGMWRVIKPIPLVHLGKKLKHNAVIASARGDSLFDSLKYDEQNMLSLKIIDSFLCDEFSKDVPIGERWKYKLSAAYAELVKREDQVAGLLYPSLRTNGAGYNVALFPEHVYDYIKLERAALMTYYKRGDSIGNEIIMEAFPVGEDLVWKDIYDHKMPPQVKRWYIGLSDDDSFQQYIPVEDL